ncbi:MAG: formate hydrogenlyase transcriptional activator [Mariniblastus sp.]
MFEIPEQFIDITMNDDISTIKTASGTEKHLNQMLELMLEQLSMGSSFEQLFDSVYDRLNRIVPFNRIAVALMDDSSNLLRLTSCRSDDDVALKVGYAAHLKGSTLAQLLETGQPRVIDDLEEYLASKPESASTKLIVREGMKSSLTLPLIANGKPIGVIFFSSRKRKTYTREHATLLRRLAGPIAISIEKAQLIHELQQSNVELAEANKTKDDFLDRLKSEVEKQTEQVRFSEQRYRLLVQLSQIVNSSLDVRKVFEYAAEQINKLLDCDRVSLLLAQRPGTTRYGFALNFEGQAGYRWVDIPTRSLTGSAFDWVMEHRRPRIASLTNEAHQFPEDKQLFSMGYRCKVYLPLISRDLAVGVLGIASRQNGQSEHWDLELLNEICEQLAIALDNAAAYGEIDRLKGELEIQNVYLREEIRTDHDVGNIIGDSSAMKQVRVAIEQVAQSDSTVLILGETGTGKELIARAIHDSSQRSENLLVKVNCAALAPGLIASELFGHEVGAFTGATELRRGRFELSHRGSIFLDEISEVPAETQVMLLRVLQERFIERVGGNEPIQIDTRVIAATNRDLKKYTEDGHFRDDLYYRLHVFPIHVPPLRERREDIPALLNHFIERFSKRMHKSITGIERQAMDALMQYDWPGNVRELENIVERSMIISQSDTLRIDASWLAGDGSPPNSSEVESQRVHPSKQSLAEIERQAILSALARCHGKVYGKDGAAAELDVKPTTLYGKMTKYKIKGSRQHKAM